MKATERLCLSVETLNTPQNQAGNLGQGRIKFKRWFDLYTLLQVYV